MVKKASSRSKSSPSSASKPGRPARSASGRAEEPFYRLLFDANPVPSWVWDSASLRFLAVNDAALRLYGYGRGEFLAMTVKDIRPAEDLPGLLKAFAQLGDRAAHGGVWRHRRKDGELIWVDVTHAPVRFKGRPARLVSLRNIAEPLKSRDPFRGGRALYQGLAGVAFDGIAIQQEGVIRYIAPSLAELFGYEPSEMLGRPALDFVAPEDREAVGARLRASGEDGRHEVLGLRRDGSRLRLSLSLKRGSYEGKPALLAAMRDLTREREEEHLRLRQAAVYEGLLRALADMGQGVVLLEGNRILFANEAFCRASGYAQGELKELASCFDLLDGEEARKMEERLRSHLAGDEVPGRYDTCLKRKDGGLVDVEMSVKALSLEGRSNLLVMARDITGRKKSQASLLHQTQFYLAILEAQSDVGEGMLVMEQGRLIYANEAICRITGYSWKELNSLDSVARLLPGDRQEAFQEALGGPGAGQGEGRHFQTVFLHKSGQEVEMEVSLKVLPFEGRAQAVAVLRDVTQRNRSLQSLMESEQRYGGLVESAFDGVIVHQDGLLVSANRPFHQMLGYDEGELDGRPITEITAPESRETIQRAMREGLESPYEAQGLRKDGTLVKVEICSKNCLYRGRPARISAIRDMSERVKAEERIRHQAYHDALTGLPNRLLFQDHLALQLAQAHRDRQMMAILFLDLDRLKAINDTLGHETGDQLLIQVGQRLREGLSAGDTVARVGGDEFTVLLPNLTRAEESMQSAERILRSFEPPFSVSGQEVHLGASIGISLYPSDGEDAETLLRNADLALNRAKDQGRNNYQLFTPVMNARAFERLTLENQLRRALEQGQFILHYQPLVDLKGGGIEGAEALLRWRHPEQGLVFPEHFIPLAEETGLIVPLGEWVLRESLAQMARWKAAGLPPVKVAVNLSARQFQQEGLLPQVLGALKATGVEPGSFTLEITESLAMKDAEYTYQILKSFQQMGVSIAIDDFGTGHSSLSYLKKFPLRTLKIDRSFVRGTPADSQDAAIVRAVIALARSMNLRVVAEGVEKPEQAIFLRQQGCDSFQGYWFSRAVAPDEFADMLRQGKRISL